MSFKTIVKSAIPASYGAYWYFSAYLPLAIFEPFIVRALNKVDDRQLKQLFILIILVFSFSGLLNDSYKTEFGYSFLWLTLLFILGYAIKRLNMFSKWSSAKLFIISFTTAFCSWLLLAIAKNGILINQVSPTILFNAIFLLILFSRIRPNEKIIRFISPLTFGIYLCQNNRIAWNNLNGAFLFVKNFNVYAVVPSIIGIASLLFISCALVEFTRRQLFKLIKIDRLSNKINSLVMISLSKIENLLFK